MFKNIILIFLIIGFSVCNAEIIGKVEIESETVCADQTVSLNGAGIRTKLFIKLYVASLYVQEKSNNADEILSMTQASCMRLHITSSKITSKKMIKATKEGFTKATGGNTEPIKNEIDTFLSWLAQPIKKQDVFEFSFTPDDVVTVSKNNNVLGEIKNHEFAIALFGIWLGDQPAQTDLKEKLLGN